MSLLSPHLRAILRIPVFAGVMGMAAATLVFHRRSLASRAYWLRASCRRALAVMGVRISAVGTEPEGAIIVANHLSYLDVLVLAASEPVVFVAKREVQDWPVFGWFAQCAGTRFIDRERRSDVVRVGEELAEAIAAGVSVVLFLEGTSTDGRAVNPFKSSLLEPAVANGWSVTPAAIAYGLPSGHEVAREICWWGDMTLMPHLFHLLTLPRVAAHVAWGTSMSATGDRKAFTALLHTEVSCLHRRLKDKLTAAALPAMPGAMIVSGNKAEAR